jgi:cellulose synthase/poly-beta-1,6-N-acetylglucosamine synthase-like glycosyltransferase
MTFILIISSIIGACYFGLISLFTYGWFKNKSRTGSLGTPHTKVSIIVPFRNEKENMLTLLQSLSEQNFPSELLEVLLVDDHSSDHSGEIAESFISKNGIKNFKILTLSDADDFSKKAALKKGIENSCGTLIITTDADCIFKKNWLRATVNYFEQKKCRLISAAVVTDNSKGFFAKLQSFEFLSLVASGAGAMSAQKPIMANGANLCFERSLYNELNGYNTHDSYASGDDVFFLFEAKKHCKDKNELCFLKDPESIVITQGPRNLKEFMHQRIRWASKSTAYKDTLAVFTALIIFLFNLSIPVLLLCGIFNLWFTVMAAMLFTVKLFADFPILFSAARFVRRSELIWYYFPMQLIYPFYIIITAVLSFFMKFEWKGRKRKR